MASRLIPSAQPPGAEPHIRTVVDGIVEAFVLIDENERVLDWNPGAEATFGWSRAEALGAQVSELLVPARLRPAHRAGLARVLADGESGLIGRRIEVVGRHRDGHELTLELTLSRADHAKRPRFAALLHDVTERKEAQRALRRLAAIVEASEDAIVSGGLDWTIETWNAGAERIFGFTAAEAIGHSALHLLQAGEPVDVSAIEAQLQAGRPVALEPRGHRKDGSRVDLALNLSPLTDEAGAVIGVAAIARDLTERNRTTARLAQAHSRFVGAFDAATIGMALVGPDGRFLEVNAALCRLLGRDAAQLRLSTFQELTHPDDLDADVDQLEALVAGEIEGYGQDKRYLLPGGGIIWAQLTVTAVRDDERKLQYVVSQVQDITARRTAQDELARYAAQLTSLTDRDGQTGLANRRAFMASLTEELHLQAAGGGACGVLLVDVGAEPEQLVESAERLEEASRSADLVAHLGGGQLAVLLTAVDALSTEEVELRVRAALGDHVRRSAHVTSRPGESSTELLERAHRLEEEPASRRGSGAPAGVERLLSFAREQLDMGIAFLTRLDGDRYVFEALSGDLTGLGVSPGDAMPLAGTHCRRMLDGSIGSTVGDLLADPETRELDATRLPGLRAYAGVPVRLRSGELYGTLCAVDRQVQPDLGPRDVRLLRFLSEMVGELVDEQAASLARRHAESSTTGVRALLGALEARDYYTGEHSKEVVALAGAVARRLGHTADVVRDIEQVALLHDIGKLGVPDAILQKQGPLDDQEWELMRQHPVIGEHIVAGIPGLAHLSPAMRAEHERWDGGGYPDGLRATAIPLASRVILACDALHAMTSDRPYRQAKPLADALQELSDNAGTQFDHEVVDALIGAMSERGQ